MRTVIFQLKLSARHTGVMRSSSTRLPAGGALGRMRFAGESVRVDIQAQSVERVVQATAAMVAHMQIPG